MGDLLTTSEVAELLGKPLRTVQRMAKQGRLPAAQKLPASNGTYLFSREVVELVQTQGRGAT